MLIVFWSCVAALAWVFVFYPVLTLLRGRLTGRPCLEGDIEPRVSVLVIAYNEADSIVARIRNLLSQDYPQDRLQIVVASDGSDDGTVQLAQQFESERVSVLNLPRRGKIPTLNDAVQVATGEVLVMTDANSHFRPDTLRQLLRPLADPAVGGVAGNQVYARSLDAALNAQGECWYWNLDRLLKRAQSQAGSVISATGAIYAIRRKLVPTVPSAVTDDFYISTSVLAGGQRLVFAPAAVAIEPVAARRGAEFARKVRVMTRGFRALWLRRDLFNPRRTGVLSLDLLTWKLMKRLLAIPLALLLLSTAVLAMESLVFRWILAAELCGLLLAGVGLLAGGSRLGRSKVFAIPAYLCMANAAAVVALVNAVRGRRIDRWEPQRPESPPASTGEPAAMEVARS